MLLGSMFEAARAGIGAAVVETAELLRGCADEGAAGFAQGLATNRAIARLTAREATRPQPLVLLGQHRGFDIGEAIRRIRVHAHHTDLGSEPSAVPHRQAAEGVLLSGG
ncbi:MAG: hypothetical protein JWM98_3251 [Thermoleophilia bacterium]|nr:hypothetical protein [Thermoleophilia bacterium]